MQTQSLSHLIFPNLPGPAVKAQAQGGAPAAPAQPAPAVQRDMPPRSSGGPSRQAPDAAPGPGVIYTGSAQRTGQDAAPAASDLKEMSLDSLYELGRSRGVFTKITYNRHGALDGAQGAGAAQADFVSSAVTVMRDFEEGMAVLKGAAAETPTPGFWQGGLRQAAARLNVFA